MKIQSYQHLLPTNAPFVGRLGVAVSGGGDSVALVLLLLEAGWSPTELLILHVNHGLREASQQEERFVASFAKTHHVTCKIIHLQHTSLETKTADALRQARRSFFTKAREQHQLAAIALAHNADDQRETRWLAMIRGAGLRGLAGMSAWQAPFWRPLLGVTRLQLRQYLQQKQQVWCEDPTNLDFRHPRARLRHHVLPSVARPLTTSEVLRSNMLGDEEYFLDALTNKASDDICCGAAINIRVLQDLDVAIARRVLKRWLPGRTSLNRVESLRQAMATRQDRLRTVEMGAGLAVIVDPYWAMYYWPGQLQQAVVPAQLNNITWQGFGHFNLKINTGTENIAKPLQLMALGVCTASHRFAKPLRKFLVNNGVSAALRYLWPVVLMGEHCVGTLPQVVDWLKRYKISLPIGNVVQIENVVWEKLLTDL